MYYRALTILCVKFAVVSPCNALLLVAYTFLSLNLAQVARSVSENRIQYSNALLFCIRKKAALTYSASCKDIMSS